MRSLMSVKIRDAGRLLCFGMLMLTHNALAGVTTPTDLETARAKRVAEMPDTTPSHRINQMLAARNFNDAELFVLASTSPGVVEQLVSPAYRVGVNYLFSLVGAELHRIRNAGTLIRTTNRLSGAERRALDDLCDHFGYDSDKLRGIKFGPKDGRVYELEVTIQIKKKKTVSGSMELAWPPTPNRDETSRTTLTKYFGARPSRIGRGYGSLIPLQDGSFEKPGTLGPIWQLVAGTNLGHHTPAQEVVIDGKKAMDGTKALRFHATAKTRQFYKVSQRVNVTPGTSLRLRAQVKTEAIRIEFQQKRGDFYVALTHLDGIGRPMGQAQRASGRLGSHGWELLEIETTVPPGASQALIEVVSAHSGTAWYDAVIIEVIDPGAL
jgi:hypothetical protein